ncbi:MAG: FadR/GntR family transcriptional regulator [Solirubrobacterales bacterium]
MPAGNQLGERLLALLADGGYEAGSRLPPERDLATELGVSRASLREGLRRFVDLGILESRPGSGTYLVEVDLPDLIAVRLRLEPYAAELAARRRSSRDLERLDALVLELRDSLADAVAFGDADARLHEAIVSAARSPSLRTLLDALHDLLRYSRTRTATDPALRATALTQLEELAKAIREGAGQAASRAMRSHLRAVAESRPNSRSS